MKDVRYDIFSDIIEKSFKAELTAERKGIFSGSKEVLKQSQEIGVTLELFLQDGDSIKQGQKIGFIKGNPVSIAIAEEKIIGCLAKYCGIATAANHAIRKANGKVKIVAGSWKKMPPQIKEGVRDAVSSGGATSRISDGRMLYLDKNFIKMFGSIEKSLKAVGDMEGYDKVVQLKGIDFSIEEETIQAIKGGGDILMIDTGKVDDVSRCLDIIIKMDMRDKVRIAFAGNVKINKIEELSQLDIDILCIGKEIVDAKLLDFRLDVVI
jgi:nicotinate-nucleotide pyrophosphorylase (carboxylating)